MSEGDGEDYGPFPERVKCGYRPASPMEMDALSLEWASETAGRRFYEVIRATIETFVSEAVLPRPSNLLSADQARYEAAASMLDCAVQVAEDIMGNKDAWDLFGEILAGMEAPPPEGTPKPTPGGPYGDRLAEKLRLQRQRQKAARKASRRS